MWKHLYPYKYTYALYFYLRIYTCPCSVTNACVPIYPTDLNVLVCSCLSLHSICSFRKTLSLMDMKSKRLYGNDEVRGVEKRKII